MVHGSKLRHPCELRRPQSSVRVAGTRLPPRFGDGRSRRGGGHVGETERDRLSPDFGTIYIVDTSASHKRGHPRTISACDVLEGKRLTNGRIFCGMGKGGSDGIRMDVDGNVWSAAGWGGEGFDSVHVFAPNGAKIGEIHLPEAAFNVCCGGVKRNRLFMTASQSLYSLYVEDPRRALRLTCTNRDRPEGAAM